MPNLLQAKITTEGATAPSFFVLQEDKPNRVRVPARLSNGDRVSQWFNILGSCKAARLSASDVRIIAYFEKGGGALIHRDNLEFV